MKDEVLLKLRRLYSKEEGFAYVDKLYREACIKNGMLIAERNEAQSKLKDHNHRHRMEIANLKDEVKRVTENHKSLVKTNDKLRKENAELLGGIVGEDGLSKKYKELKQLKQKYDSLRSILISNNLMPTSDYYNIDN